MTIYTIGHSTRELAEFTDLLRQYGIATLADVRRYPVSRRYPHFSRERLEPDLEQLGIHYLHLPDLGGRREPLEDSRNTAWRNDQFRGYADHMGTAEFRAGIDRVLSAPAPVSLMCAEAVPWRCHRNLISDELTRRGHEVIHILGGNSTKLHERNPDSVERDGVLIYPSRASKLF